MCNVIWKMQDNCKTWVKSIHDFTIHRRFSKANLALFFWCACVYTHGKYIILTIRLRQWRICPQSGRPGFNPWVGEIPWRRKWQPLQYSCLEKPHLHRSLAGYSSRGRRESDMTERPSTQHTYLQWSPFCIFQLACCFPHCRTHTAQKPPCRDMIEGLEPIFLLLGSSVAPAFSYC